MMINRETLQNEMHKNPRKIIQFLIGLSICFLLIWVVVASQMESPSSQYISVEESGRLDSLKLFLKDNNSIAAVTDKAKSNPSSISNQSTGVVFPGLLCMLVIVSGLWWWIKNKSNGQRWGDNSSNSLFKIVESQELELGQKLILIEMNEQYWLLAVSANKTNLLHHCRKDEWKGLVDVKENKDKQFNSSQKSFLDVLREQGQKYGFRNN